MNMTVIGAGAWGTALAVHFARHGHRTVLWTRNEHHAEDMQRNRANNRYLPGIALPPELAVSHRPEEALAGSRLVLIATPVAGLRDSARLLQEHKATQLPVLAACKGFEPGSGLLPFQVLREILPENDKIGLLSGPSFAQELAEQLPCAVVLASENENWINSLVQELNSSVLRLYANTDQTGVAVGGAVKNVMAIATGLSDGLGYGLNARAALITRGLAEITRLAAAMGAQQKTLMGLAGMGDLILTCTGDLSRNRKVGLGLAQGKRLQQILGELGHVAEGVLTIDEVLRTAGRFGVEMPLTEALHRLINGQDDARSAVEQLMQRAAKAE